MYLTLSVKSIGVYKLAVTLFNQDKGLSKAWRILPLTLTLTQKAPRGGGEDVLSSQ